MSDDRLTRMEDKLDKLSEAVLAIARMEERMLTVFKRLENVDASIKKMDDRIDEIEKQAISRGQKIAFAERIFWMILTGAVGLCFVYLR
jgi:septal ring factor EnvC (AmiA/AmiB activator)